jgi:hypothetical protein
MQLIEGARIVSGLAGGVGVVVAIVAAFFAANQVYLSNRLAAHEAYGVLLSRMLDFPEFADPDYDKILSDRALYQKYKRYVGYLLTVGERVLLAEPRTEYWKNTVLYFCWIHRKHLASEDFRLNHRPHFSRVMRIVFDQSSDDILTYAVPRQRLWQKRGVEG